MGAGRAPDKREREKHVQETPQIVHRATGSKPTPDAADKKSFF